MRIVIEAESMAELGLYVDEDGEQISDGLTDAIAERLALALIARVSEKEVDRLLKAGIRKAIGSIVNKTVNQSPSKAPVTLLQMIQAEVEGQLRDSYSGVSTPLNQVVAAEVYRVMHDELIGLLNRARKQINERVPQEVANIVQRAVAGQMIR